MPRLYPRQNAKARSNSLEMQNFDQTVEPNASWYLHNLCVVTLTHTIARTIGILWIPRPLRHPWFSGRLGREALGTNDTDHLAPFLESIMYANLTGIQTLWVYFLYGAKKSRENKLLCWFIKKIILCIRWKALYNSLARVRGEEKTRIPLALIPHLSPH